MLKLGFVTLAALLIHSPGSAQSPAPDERTEIVRLEDAWRQARIERDLPFLEHFYAKDMRIQWLDGSLLSRKESIARFRRNDSTTDFIRHGPLDVMLSGDIAVVTGVDHVGGRTAGQYGEMRVRFTDILVKRDERWQLLLHHATRTQHPA